MRSLSPKDVVCDIFLNEAFFLEYILRKDSFLNGKSAVSSHFKDTSIFQNTCEVMHCGSQDQEQEDGVKREPFQKAEAKF